MFYAIHITKRRILFKRLKYIHIAEKRLQRYFTKYLGHYILLKALLETIYIFSNTHSVILIDQLHNSINSQQRDTITFTKRNNKEQLHHQNA